MVPYLCTRLKSSEHCKVKGSILLHRFRNECVGLGFDFSGRGRGLWSTFLLTLGCFFTQEAEFVLVLDKVNADMRGGGVRCDRGRERLGQTLLAAIWL